MKQSKRRIRSSSTPARAIGVLVLTASLTQAGWVPASGATPRAATSGRVHASASTITPWYAIPIETLGGLTLNQYLTRREGRPIAGSGGF